MEIWKLDLTQCCICGIVIIVAWAARAKQSYPPLIINSLMVVHLQIFYHFYTPSFLILVLLKPRKHCAPTAKPPVCKIIDYGKYRYELARKEKEAKKKQRTMEKTKKALRKPARNLPKNERKRGSQKNPRLSKLHVLIRKALVKFCLFWQASLSEGCLFLIYKQNIKEENIMPKCL